MQACHVMSMQNISGSWQPHWPERSYGRKDTRREKAGSLQFPAQRESEKNSRLPRQKGHHSREETKAAQATKKILEIVRRELKDNRFLTHIRDPPKI